MARTPRTREMNVEHLRRGDHVKIGNAWYTLADHAERYGQGRQEVRADVIARDRYRTPFDALELGNVGDTIPTRLRREWADYYAG